MYIFDKNVEFSVRYAVANTPYVFVFECAVLNPTNALFLQYYGLFDAAICFLWGYTLFNPTYGKNVI